MSHIEYKIEKVFEVWVTLTKLTLISPLFIPINSNLVEVFSTLFMSIKPRYIGPCSILQKSGKIYEFVKVTHLKPKCW